MLGALAFNIVMYGSGLLLSLYARALSRLAPRLLPGVARSWARLVLAALRMFCGVALEIDGLENLPRGAALIAAQHQSMLDIFIWLAILPRPIFVLKQELTRIPLFGPSLRPTGNIAVDRAGGAASLRAMVADCHAALAAGRQIVVFPEGTRVPPGERVVLQPGIVAVARALGVPVIPAATDTGRRWGRRSFAKVPGVARVIVAPALPAGMTRAELLAALDRYYHGEEAPSA